MRRFRREEGRRNVLLRVPWKAGAAGLKDARASAQDFRLRGKPRAFAQSKTDSIRPRIRLAVSGVFAQSGSSTFITIPTLIEPTGTRPNAGETCRASEF